MIGPQNFVGTDDPLAFLMTFLHLLRADAKHYNYENGERWYRHSGFWVGAVYRFGHLAGTAAWPLRFPLWSIYVLAATAIRAVLHVDIPRHARIGPGFCMHHPQNILLSSDATVGCDVTIYQEVTIGRGPIPGIPTLGDRVVVYAGARILGGVTVGDDCEIGANVVITKDVPPGSVASSAPVRAIPKGTIERLRHGGGSPRPARWESTR